jgi:2-polyprenyl-3-methyl-5-hydroxy-6-metoxy-1,4-benzoquinol methylase
MMPVFVAKCVVCQSEDFEADERATFYLNLVEPFAVVRCTNCDMRWLNPRPSDEEYLEIYEADYFEGGQSMSDGASTAELARLFPPPADDYESDHMMKRRVGWYVARLKRLGKLLPEGKTLFDVGAATGDFMALARERGWEVSGLEPSEHARQQALENYNLALEPKGFREFDPGGRTFDVVHLAHVFEHFTRPIEMLDKLAGMMHSGSLLVIEVPNQFDAWVITLADKIRRVKQIRRNLQSIHHPYFYKPKLLIQLLRENGFSVISVRTYFPERWKLSRLHRVAGVVDVVGDWMGRHGRHIEVIAKIAPD